LTIKKTVKQSIYPCALVSCDTHAYYKSLCNCQRTKQQL
jgi:hypothetical protein